MPAQGFGFCGSAVLRHLFPRPVVAFCICSPTVGTGNSEVHRLDRRRPRPVAWAGLAAKVVRTNICNQKKPEDGEMREGET